MQSVAPEVGAEPELTEDQKELRRLTLDWVEALAHQDVDRLMALSSPDVQLFHLEPPLRLEGLEAYRRLWQACEPDGENGIRPRCRDLRISAGSDVGFASFLVAVRNPNGPNGPEHGARESWVRGTLCYERVSSGRWQVVHEHRSAPVSLRTGRASFDMPPVVGMDRLTGPR